MTTRCLNKFNTKLQFFVTKSELHQHLLESVNHSHEKRKQMSTLALENPTLMEPLLSIAFDVDDPVSCKSCWVIEFTVKEKRDQLFPFIDLFINNLNRVKFDSSIRPCAKICEILIKDYFSKTKNATQKVLTEEHLEGITTACFDWLIGEHKVAAKAYSMTSLLLLGRKYDWIHPELKMVLEQNYENGTAAYKARARMVLAKLK